MLWSYSVQCPLFFVTPNQVLAWLCIPPFRRHWSGPCPHSWAVNGCVWSRLLFTSGWHKVGAQLRSPLEQNMEHFEQNTQNKKKAFKWMESRANICVGLSDRPGLVPPFILKSVADWMINYINIFTLIKCLKYHTHIINYRLQNTLPLYSV